MSDLLNQDNDTSIQDLLDEVMDNEEKRGRGALKGRPKPAGSGRQKQILNERTWAKLDNASYIVTRIREVLDGRDFNELSNDELMRHLKAFNEFIQPKLSAVKQQTITIHSYDTSSLTEEQLQVLMAIPVTHSIGEDIETITPLLDAPEDITDDTTEEGSITDPL